ncbi:hypothetical protein [Campylobacter hyointestinalis]|uniref:hypothetical protein n=1 Tax=Campylobacter hyointestinalis TaxID=198 RepID=UPI0014793952|nr:hypothetical protein [Campylobacter hyointestinalis]
MSVVIGYEKEKIDNLDSMIRGWFVGDFEPNVLKSDQVEVKGKKLQKRRLINDILVIII